MPLYNLRLYSRDLLAERTVWARTPADALRNAQVLAARELERLRFTPEFYRCFPVTRILVNDPRSGAIEEIWQNRLHDVHEAQLFVLEEAELIDATDIKGRFGEALRQLQQALTRCNGGCR